MEVITEQMNATLPKETDIDVDSWLLMSSPYPLGFIVLFYLYFVTSLGPQLMKNRPPFNLNAIMFIYNAYQVYYNVWILKTATTVQHPGDLLICKPHAVDHEVIVTLGWWYFFAKVIELLDTVFFVLRKKQNQVTLLHVYHHALLVAFTWIYVKYLPDGQGAFMGLFNALVHVVMYIYYFLAGLGPSIQKYLWWKKYITWLQLIQFTAVMMYLLYIIYIGCNVPVPLIAFYIINDIIFIAMFIDFYRKAYQNRVSKSISSENVLSKMK